MRNILIIMISVLSSQFFYIEKSFAREVVDVCATYTNTNKKYKVEANVYSGTDLNKLTKTFNYNSFSTYAIIFWGPEQATIIELSYAIGNKISQFGTSGKDQRGYEWNLSTLTSFCF
jgi:hypothetical protein